VKLVLLFLGLLFLVIGIIGVFIPGLPTTPFLLLSSGLFFYSSDRLYHWISNHKLFGKYIKSYRENKAISLQIKIRSVVLMWVMILLSIIFFTEEKLVRIIIVSAGIVGTLVMLLIPTLKK
jgi:uncharacterized protein